jgi:hypothetical protein
LKVDLFLCFPGLEKVVADHHRVSAELPQVLDQVVRERVVVVEDEDPV